LQQRSQPHVVAAAAIVQQQLLIGQIGISVGMRQKSELF